MTPELDQMIISVNRVASFPHAVHRVNAAVDDPHHSLRKIGSIIAEDPGLSSRLLKIANSKLYNLPTPVNTITRALTVIGTKQLRDLIHAAHVMEMFNGNLAARVDMDAFWRHSIACGVAARVIATARREANVERFYLTGLLHDIGRLVLFLERPDQAVKLLEESQARDLPLHTVEQEVLGFDHAVLGSELLRNWNLPPDLSTPVRFHHIPSKAEDFILETAIIHVADIIALALLQGYEGERTLPPLDPAAWDQIGLPASSAHSLLTFMEAQFADAADLFLSESSAP